MNIAVFFKKSTNAYHRASEMYNGFRYLAFYRGIHLGYFMENNFVNPSSNVSPEGDGSRG